MRVIELIYSMKGKSIIESKRNHENEKYVMTIQKYTQGMDLVSYIHEFEQTVKREDIV